MTSICKTSLRIRHLQLLPRHQGIMHSFIQLHCQFQMKQSLTSQPDTLIYTTEHVRYFPSHKFTINTITGHPKQTANEPYRNASHNNYILKELTIAKSMFVPRLLSTNFMGRDTEDVCEMGKWVRLLRNRCAMGQGGVVTRSFHVDSGSWNPGLS